MRVRIQRGSSSIEIDGDYSEIEKVLTNWWGTEISDVEETPEPFDRAEKPAARRPRAKRASNGDRVAKKSGFDAQAVVNRVREHPQFELIRAKIILGEASRGQRAKFVSWVTHDQPLTTGDIQRVLQGLGVKIDPATTSRAMGDVKDDYIKDTSSTPVTYHLTARGYSEFEQWLLNAE